MIKKDIIKEFKKKFVIMNCQSMTHSGLNGNIWNNVIKFLEKYQNKINKIAKPEFQNKINKIAKPELWMENTPENELELLKYFECNGIFMTRRMGGCIEELVGSEEVKAHYKHKEELMEYLIKIK